ncbi:MAG: hypothetical protein JO368_01030 [Acidimicrobiales bacterium]|nr:hypothetical protein [Acidimicrobiales bacterium]
MRPVMNEILQEKGLVKVGEDRVLVTGVKGPLEDGWADRVAPFADTLPLEPARRAPRRSAPTDLR